MILYCNARDRPRYQNREFKWILKRQIPWKGLQIHCLTVEKDVAQTLVPVQWLNGEA